MKHEWRKKKKKYIFRKMSLSKIDYRNEHSLTKKDYSREIYIKGPGMLFRGNPQKYITEVQVPIE